MMNKQHPPLQTIVIATKNPGKIAELRSLLEPTGIRAIGLDELETTTTEPEETGTTFLENATIKALDYASQTGLPCLADDSGLAVDALNGRPGVISSHFAWDGRTTGEPAELSREQRDLRNNTRLLNELEAVAPSERTARFVCVMVLAAQGQVLADTSGTFEGRIGEPPSVPAGDQGFGYDPLFLVSPEHTQTSAQLKPAQKNTLSHRGEALRKMIHEITRLSASN